LVYFYRESVTPRVGRQFTTEVLDLTPRIERHRAAVTRQLAKRRDEVKREPQLEGIGPAFFNQEV